MFQDVFIRYHASPFFKGTPFLGKILVSQVIKFNLKKEKAKKSNFCELWLILCSFNQHIKILIISGLTLLLSSTVWIYRHLNCLCVATGVHGAYLWERNFSVLCWNNLRRAELKEARLCEGDREWLCLTAQAAFLLVIDTGKKKFFLQCCRSFFRVSYLLSCVWSQADTTG